MAHSAHRAAPSTRHTARRHTRRPTKIVRTSSTGVRSESNAATKKFGRFVMHANYPRKTFENNERVFKQVMYEPRPRACAKQATPPMKAHLICFTCQLSAPSASNDGRIFKHAHVSGNLTNKNTLQVASHVQCNHPRATTTLYPKTMHT